MPEDIRVSVGADTRPLAREIDKVRKKGLRLDMGGMSNFKNPLGKITGQLGEFEKSLEASNARVLAFGASAGALVAVQQGLRAIVNESIQVEKSLADINVILNVSSKTLNTFSKDLFSVARNTGQSFEAVAEAATELSRQGLSVQETLKRTQDALVLTRLSGLKAAESVEAVTAALNSFSQAALESGEFVSKLAAVDAAFAVSSGDLAKAIQRVGSSAQEAGVSLDQLIAIVTSAQQITARGGAVIGNSFKTIFTRIQRPRVLKELENLGIATTDIAGNTRPAIQILSELAKTFDTLSSSQRAQISELVGGVFQVNVLKASLRDLGKEFSLYNNALEISATATDEAARRNEELNKTVAATLNQTIQNFKQFGSQAGQLAFGPAIQNVLGGINTALEDFDLKQAETLGERISAGVLGGIGRFLAGPGLLVGAVTLVKVFSRLGSQLTDAFKTISGLGAASRQQADLQAKILQTLQANPQLLDAIESGTLDVASAHKLILDGINKESQALNRQIGIVKQLATLLAGQGVRVSTVLGGGQALTPKGAKLSSSGFIPNFASREKALRAMELRNASYATPSTRAVRDNIAGVGSVIRNTREDKVTAPGFRQPFINPPKNSVEGKIHRANSIRQTGIDPYLLSQGFVPNFAEGFKKLKTLKASATWSTLSKIFPSMLSRGSGASTAGGLNPRTSPFQAADLRDRLSANIQVWESNKTASQLRNQGINNESFETLMNRARGLTATTATHPRSPVDGFGSSAKIANEAKFIDDLSLLQGKDQTKKNYYLGKMARYAYGKNALRAAIKKDGKPRSKNIGTLRVGVPSGAGAKLRSKGHVPNFAEIRDVDRIKSVIQDYIPTQVLTGETLKQPVGLGKTTKRLPTTVFGLRPSTRKNFRAVAGQEYLNAVSRTASRVFANNYNPAAFRKVTDRVSFPQVRGSMLQDMIGGLAGRSGGARGGAIDLGPNTLKLIRQRHGARIENAFTPGLFDRLGRRTEIKATLGAVRGTATQDPADLVDKGVRGYLEDRGNLGRTPAEREERTRLVRGVRSTIKSLSQGFIPNFATGIFDSDKIRGGRNVKNQVLDAILNSGKPIQTFHGAAGTGKSTLAAKRFGRKFILSMADINKYTNYAVISGAGRSRKTGALSARTQKIFDRSSKITGVVPTNQDIIGRRLKRVDEAKIFGSPDARDIAGLKGTLKAPLNDFRIYSDLRRQGKNVELLRSMGFVPSFNAMLGYGKGSISNAIKTEKAMGGDPVLDFNRRVGLFVRDGKTQKNFSDVLRDHPEGLSSAIKNSRAMQNQIAASAGYVPNFAPPKPPPMGSSKIPTSLANKINQGSGRFGGKELSKNANDASSRLLALSLGIPLLTESFSSLTGSANSLGGELTSGIGAAISSSAAIAATGDAFKDSGGKFGKAISKFAGPVGIAFGAFTAISSIAKSLQKKSRALVAEAEASKEAFTKLNNNLSGYASAFSEFNSAAKNANTSSETLLRLREKLDNLLADIPDEFALEIGSITQADELQSKIAEIIRNQGKRDIQTQISAGIQVDLDEASGVVSGFVQLMGGASKEFRTIFDGAAGQIKAERLVTDLRKGLNFTGLAQDMARAGAATRLQSASQNQLVNILGDQFGATAEVQLQLRQLSTADFEKFRRELIETANAARRAREAQKEIADKQQELSEQLALGGQQRAISILTENAKLAADALKKMAGGVEAFLDPDSFKKTFDEFQAGLRTFAQLGGGVAVGAPVGQSQQIGLGRGALGLAESVFSIGGIAPQLNSRTGLLDTQSNPLLGQAQAGLQANIRDTVTTAIQTLQRQLATVRPGSVAAQGIQSSITQLQGQLDPKIIERAARIQLAERLGVEEQPARALSIGEAIRDPNDRTQVRQVTLGQALGDIGAGNDQQVTSAFDNIIRQLENSLAQEEARLRNPQLTGEQRGEVNTAITALQTALGNLTPVQGMDAATLRAQDLTAISQLMTSTGQRAVGAVSLAGPDAETPAEMALRQAQDNLRISQDNLANEIKLLATAIKQRQDTEISNERQQRVDAATQQLRALASTPSGEIQQAGFQRFGIFGNEFHEEIRRQLLASVQGRALEELVSEVGRGELQTGTMSAIAAASMSGRDTANLLAVGSVAETATLLSNQTEAVTDVFKILPQLLKQNNITQLDSEALKALGESIKEGSVDGMVSAANNNAKVTAKIIRELLLQSTDANKESIRSLIEEFIKLNQQPQTQAPRPPLVTSALGPASLRAFQKAAIKEASAMGGSKQDVMFDMNPRTGGFEAFHATQGSLANAKRQHAFGQRIRNNQFPVQPPRVPGRNRYSALGFSENDFFRDAGAKSVTKEELYDAILKAIKQGIGVLPSQANMSAEAQAQIALEQMLRTGRELQHYAGSPLNSRGAEAHLNARILQEAQMGRFNLYGEGQSSGFNLRNAQQRVRDLNTPQTDPQTGLQGLAATFEPMIAAAELAEAIKEHNELSRMRLEEIKTGRIPGTGPGLTSPGAAPLSADTLASLGITTNTTVNIESERAEAVVAQVAQATQDTLIQIADQTQQYNPELSAAIRTHVTLGGLTHQVNGGFGFSAIKRDRFGRPIQ